MNINKSFRIKSLIGEEATCWPISPYRLSVFWESGVHEFWTPKDMEDMIAHYGWEKLEDSAQQITRIKECSANAYTASLWQISDHFYTLQWDHWVESMTYCKEDVVDNFAKGIWTKVEEELKSFKFDCRGNKYQYIQGGDIYFDENPLKFVTNTSEEKARGNVESGNWIVLPSEPFSFAGSICDVIKTLGEVEQSNTTLEAIKSFTTDSGHDVFISEGSYKVYRKGEDEPYICHSDTILIEVMKALVTLDEVGKEGGI